MSCFPMGHVLKTGDRVRVNSPDSKWDGQIATVGEVDALAAYVHRDGTRYAYLRTSLEFVPFVAGDRVFVYRGTWAGRLAVVSAVKGPEVTVSDGRVATILTSKCLSLAALDKASMRELEEFFEIHRRDRDDLRLKEVEAELRRRNTTDHKVVLFAVDPGPRNAAVVTYTFSDPCPSFAVRSTQDLLSELRSSYVSGGPLTPVLDELEKRAARHTAKLAAEAEKSFVDLKVVEIKMAFPPTDAEREVRYNKMIAEWLAVTPYSSQRLIPPNACTPWQWRVDLVYGRGFEECSHMCLDATRLEALHDAAAWCENELARRKPNLEYKFTLTIRPFTIKVSNADLESNAWDAIERWTDRDSTRGVEVRKHKGGSKPYAVLLGSRKHSNDGDVKRSEFTSKICRGKTRTDALLAAAEWCVVELAK